LLFNLFGPHLKEKGGREKKSRPRGPDKRKRETKNSGKERHLARRGQLALRSTLEKSLSGLAKKKEKVYQWVAKKIQRVIKRKKKKETKKQKKGRKGIWLGDPSKSKCPPGFFYIEK